MTSSANEPNSAPEEDLAVWTSDSHCTWSGSALQVRLGLTHAARELFVPGDFTLTSGTITGVVGVNGCGKTSTAKVLPYLPGFPSHQWTVEYLSSEDMQDTLLAQDHVGGSDKEAENALQLTPVEYLRACVQSRLRHIRQQIEELEGNMEEDQEHMEEVVNQLSELYDMAETIENSTEKEIQQSMQSLGFEPHLHKKMEELSSGWRYKARLVACFLARPQLFVIDEPSFLDTRSIEWLIQKLKDMVQEANNSSQTCIVLLISHKEYLLDALCDRILYLNAETKRLTMYHTGYLEFRELLEAQRSHADRISTETRKQEANANQSLKNLQKQLHKRELNLKATTSKNADLRFTRGKNKEAKQKADRSAASKVKQLQKQTEAAEEMLANTLRERVKPLHMEGSILDGTFATFQDVAFGFENCPPIFENVDLQLQATDRVLLEGENGVGKTTLVKLILGDYEPTQGTIVRRGKALYFPQVALNDLTRKHGHESALSFLGNSLTETEARHHLGNFGLAKDLALRPIRTLSAGQRVRLWLAHANLHNEKPALLILDEISENVDRETRQSLVEMLHSFVGAVLVISHDHDFGDSYHPQVVWTLTPYGLKQEYLDN